jgi:streptogramin lyase
MRFTTSCGLRKPFLVIVAFASLGQLCTSLIAQTVSFTEYPIPTAGSQPSRIATGSDGALWFTEFTGNKIGRSTTAGVITEFTVPTAASQPTGSQPAETAPSGFTEQIAK